jgi:hypothetical protein
MTTTGVTTAGRTTFDGGQDLATSREVRGSGLSVGDCVRAIHDVLDRVDRSDLGEPTSFAGIVRELARAASRMESLRLAVLAAADSAQVAGFSGASGTGAWFAELTKTDERAAVADASLATRLGDGRAPKTQEALVDGRVSKEHAAVIVNALEGLPPEISSDERAQAERSLLEKAGRMSPNKLRQNARRVVEDAGRSKRESDEHQGNLLRTEEERALARCRFSMHDNADGTATGSFTVPTLAADVLRKVLQQMTAPRRTSRASCQSGSSDQIGARSISWDWAHRQGVAFAEILEHLPTDRLTGKVAATVVVTVEYDRLCAQIGAAGLDTGHDISAGEARRLACNAGILPAVLGGASQMLDLGRTARFFTEAQRTALATRYDECAAQGCDRPYAWCELHHENPWQRDGRTDLDQAVPLCGHHHRRMHDKNYRTQITTVAGKKTVSFTRRT